MSSKLGVGIIGAGLWGETHAKTYATSPGVELVEVCDLDEGKARRLAETYGARRHGRGPERLLADPAIQAVSIATPDFAHVDLAIEAARAGKHILVEKPLATTVQDAERIVAEADKAGVHLMVDFHNRWNPAFAKAKDAVVKGELGEPLLFSVRLNDVLFVPTQMLGWASKTTVAWFVGSHAVDLVRFLFADEVKRVYCVKRSRLLQARGIATPDFYEATLELSRGGVAMVENCWILPNGAPNIIDFKAELIGSAGTLYMDLSHHRVLEQVSTEKASYPDVIVMPMVQGRYVGLAYESIRHFIACIVEGKTPSVTGRDGLEATRIVCAMDRSAEEGRPVDL